MQFRRLLALISCALAAILASTGSAADNKRVQVLEVRVSDQAMIQFARENPTIFMRGDWRIYDRPGRQVAEISGQGDPGNQRFRDILNVIFQSPEVVTNKTIDWELTRLVDQAGNSLSLRDADFTIVKYWNPSCKPCLEKAQDEEKTLMSVLDSYPRLTFNVLRADADPNKRLEEFKKRQQHH